MSDFNCEHCGAAILDSRNGYLTECEHYPKTERKERKTLDELLSDPEMFAVLKRIIKEL